MGEIYIRDNLRAFLSKQNYIMKTKQEDVERQVSEIEKLNQAINSLEYEMKLLRSNYESVCQQRNAIGIKLIDKNDELCILYEKSNNLESILKKGNDGISIKEDE